MIISKKFLINFSIAHHKSVRPHFLWASLNLNQVRLFHNSKTLCSLIRGNDFITVRSQNEPQLTVNCRPVILSPEQLVFIGAHSSKNRNNFYLAADTNTTPLFFKWVSKLFKKQLGNNRKFIETNEGLEMGVLVDQHFYKEREVYEMFYLVNLSPQQPLPVEFSHCLINAGIDGEPGTFYATPLSVPTHLNNGVVINSSYIDNCHTKIKTGDSLVLFNASTKLMKSLTRREEYWSFISKRFLYTNIRKAKVEGTFPIETFSPMDVNMMIEANNLGLPLSVEEATEKLFEHIETMEQPLDHEVEAFVPKPKLFDSIIDLKDREIVPFSCPVLNKPCLVDEVFDTKDFIQDFFEKEQICNGGVTNSYITKVFNVFVEVLTSIVSWFS